MKWNGELTVIYTHIYTITEYSTLWHVKTKWKLLSVNFSRVSGALKAYVYFVHPTIYFSVTIHCLKSSRDGFKVRLVYNRSVPGGIYLFLCWGDFVSVETVFYFSFCLRFPFNLFVKCMEILCVRAFLNGFSSVLLKHATDHYICQTKF